VHRDIGHRAALQEPAIADGVPVFRAGIRVRHARALSQRIHVCPYRRKKTWMTKSAGENNLSH
jgi:hypothetical protein